MVSTYLSQLDIQVLALTISALCFAGAAGLYTAKRMGQSKRRNQIRVTAVVHQTRSLEEEMHDCLQRDRWNDRMRCFGNGQSADRQRAQQIAELLRVRG